MTGEDGFAWLGLDVGALITLAAGVVGYFARSAVELIKAWGARRRARLARLQELAALLQESGEAFRSQIEMARRLMEMLAKTHPEEMPKEKLGYNRTLRVSIHRSATPSAICFS